MRNDQVNMSLVFSSVLLLSGILFTFSPAEGYMNCSQFFVIMNKAAINTHMKFSFMLHKYLGIGLLGHTVKFMFTTLNYLLSSDYYIFHSQQQCMRIPFVSLPDHHFILFYLPFNCSSLNFSWCFSNDGLITLSIFLCAYLSSSLVSINSNLDLYSSIYSSLWPIF